MNAFLYSSLQIRAYMSTLWTAKIGGKNTNVYVYVYGYKVRLHVYKNCVNVAALTHALSRAYPASLYPPPPHWKVG